MTAPTSRSSRSHRLRGRDPRSPSSGAGLRAAPVILLLIAAGLVAWSTTRGAESAVPPPSATELPVSQTDLTCPSVGSAKLSPARAGIGLTTPTTDAGGSDAAKGAVEIVPIPRGDNLTPKRAPASGEWEVVTQDDDAAETAVVSATGSLAAGASAFAATRASEEAGGGQAVVGCARPGREAWFVGAGSSVDHESTLLVSNPGDTEAIVDVSILTRDGSTDPVSGLVVKPRDVVQISMSEVAAGKGEAAIRVAASQGQIAAAVLDHWTATLQPAGTEWIPIAQAPSESLTVSPLIEDAARRELIVANPGDRTASVDIQVIGADGTFPVSEFEDLSVDPDSITLVDVPKSLDGQTAALRLDADQPVVASVRSVSPGSPADVAYGTSLPEMAGAAVVPVDLPTVDPDGLRLLASSADPSAEVEFSVTAYAADGGSLAEDTFSVPPGSSLLWEADRRQDLATDIGRVAYLVVQPTTGALFASATYAADDSSWAATPLTEAPMSVVAPGVYPLG
ncbi:MAG: DUF5719 family protein [Nocardioidaceae bacterium]